MTFIISQCDGVEYENGKCKSQVRIHDLGVFGGLLDHEPGALIDVEEETLSHQLYTLISYTEWRTFMNEIFSYSSGFENMKLVDSQRHLDTKLNELGEKSNLVLLQYLMKMHFLNG